MSCKTKNGLLLLTAVILLIGAVIAGNIITGRNTPTVSTAFIMDTVVEQKLYGKQAEQAAQEIEQRLREYEKRCSMYLSGSEIDKINQNAGKGTVEVSENTAKMIARAKELCEESRGLFDITIAPLTQLWGITGDHPQVPSEQEIEQARKLVDYRDIIIEGNRVGLRREGQSMDLGAVAKGAACDIVREVAEQYQITCGYVSIGGNLIVLEETPPGKENSYRFGIRDPQGTEAEYFATVSLNGKTMATTGTYERWFEQDGKCYHHILDPRTGYPAESDLISVSVISENGLLADCLSTTLFLEGKQAALSKMQEEEYQLVIVDKEGTVFYSPSLEQSFEPNPEKEYQFICYRKDAE